MDDKRVFIYHAECADGFGAAWAAWKRFGDSATYLPVFNRTHPPAQIESAHVYTLDYSYSPEDIAANISKAKSWTIIDHHVTNGPAIRLATDSLYDLSHSGSVLSWNYFHPGTTVPTLLRYIEDIDLWNDKLPNSRDISKAIGQRKMEFAAWDVMAAELEDPEKFKRYREEGEIIRKLATQEVEKIAKNAEEILFEGHRTLMVNSPVHVSELGAYLYRKLPPMSIIWSRRGDQVIVSLRSDGSVDVSKIAQKYGGGGHPAASGFSWTEKEFLEFKNQ